MLDLARFEALTFDCYGTLVDWESGIVGAVRPWLAVRGVRASGEEILAAYARLEPAAQAGPFRPYHEVLADVMQGLAAHFGVALAPADRRLLAESIRDWPAFPDTPGALRALGRRYRLMVVSNIDRDLFEATRPRLGVELDGVVTAEDAESYKPAPGHFRLALDRLGLAPDRVLHVAQSRYHDVAPAKALGLATVWVNRRGGRPGGATPDAAAAPRPDLEVPDLATLARLADAAGPG